MGASMNHLDFKLLKVINNEANSGSPSLVVSNKHLSK